MTPQEYLDWCRDMSERLKKYEYHFTNADRIRNMTDEELAEMFLPTLAAHGINYPDMKMVAQVIGLTKDRVNFVPELWEQTNFFFVAPTEYDEKSLAKRWKEDSPRHMTELLEVLEGVPSWDAETLDNIVMNWIAAKEFLVQGKDIVLYALVSSVDHKYLSVQ